MLQANTRIYLRDPQQADNLVPGVVSEALDQNIMVRFLQPVSFQPGTETLVSFHDANNHFTRIPCQMQRMFSKGQYPTGALTLTGEAQVAECRSATRVDIPDQSITAQVNGTDQAEVANISPGGIAMLLESDTHPKDAWLNITLQHAGDEFTGRMQVRARQQTKDNRFRYGLMADPNDPGIISQLTRITQALQTPTPQQTPQTDNPAAAGPRPGGPHQPSQRQHQRNPWPGMAKVYIREQHNLRVLSVDTEDLSRGGISFRCPQYIYEGTEALFEKPVIGGFFRVMLAIRNIRVQNGTTHRIGAQFLGAPMQPGKMPEAFASADTAA